MVRINLLRERTAEQPTAKLPVEHRPIQGILIVAVLVFAAVAFGIWYGWSKYSELKGLREQAEKLRNEAKNLDLQGIQQKLEKLQQSTELLKKRTEIIEQLKQNQTGPVAMMNALIASLPLADSKVWFESITHKRDSDGEITRIEGRSDDVPSITSFSLSLQGTGYFDAVDLLNYDETSKSVKFLIECRKIAKKTNPKEGQNG